MKQILTWKTMDGRDVKINILGISGKLVITATVAGVKVGEHLERNSKSPSGYAIGKLALSVENLKKVNDAIKLVKSSPEYNYESPKTIAREKELADYEKSYAAVHKTMLMGENKSYTLKRK